MRHLSLLAALGLSVASGPASAQSPACAPDNGGLTLPRGFCATVVAESLGPVRDTNGDGKHDLVKRFWGPRQGAAGSGIALAGDALYFASNDQVLRFAWPAGKAEPDSVPQVIVRGLPVGGHASKGIAIGKDGRLYVSIGSLTNSCQMRDRQNRSAGHQPCLELEQRAGIWRFDPKVEGQAAHLGARVATGLRNPMAVTIEPTTGTLYAGVHGRDQLTENWGWPAEAGRENQIGR